MTEAFDFANNIGQALHQIEWLNWFKAALYVGVGFLIAGFVSRTAGKFLIPHTSAHYTQIIRRLLYYGIIAVFLILALTALQLDMRVLGVATVITLAIGFASQTAVSNLISGLFLVLERPFSVGDDVEFGHTRGELLSIDLLSIKIRTPDNTLVRIPNEMLLKNQSSTLSGFAERRVEIPVRLDVHSDMNKIREILFEVAERNPTVLNMPAPQLLFEEFVEGAVIFKFAFWVNKDVYNSIRHVLPVEIIKAFQAHDLKMPTHNFFILNKS